MARSAKPALIGLLLAGCGGSAVVEEGVCGVDPAGDGSPHFKRLSDGVGCPATADARDLVFEDERAWQDFWRDTSMCAGVAAPVIDFERFVFVGVMLDGDCSYSGCEDTVPMIHGLLRRGCTLTVGVTLPTGAELGPCRACVQPRDFVTIDKRLIDGVEEIVFEHPR